MKKSGSTVRSTLAKKDVKVTTTKKPAGKAILGRGAGDVAAKRSADQGGKEAPKVLRVGLKEIEKHLDILIEKGVTDGFLTLEEIAIFIQKHR